MINPNVWVKNIVTQSAIKGAGSLIGRAFLAYLFIVAGWGKIGGYAGTAAYMESKGLPGDALILVILLELGGGLAILLGFQTRVVALFLLLFNILTAFMFHGAPDDATAFMKNIGLAGGFVYLVIYGAGRLSIDRFLEK